MFKKNVITLIWVMFFTGVASAQHSVEVNVYDAENQEPLSHATVLLGEQSQATDSEGKALFTLSAQNPLRVKVSVLGYEVYEKMVNPPFPEKMNVALQAKRIEAERVLVHGIRAQENSATTFINVSKEEIADQNLGQDIPYLLNQTPSMIASSDAGAGIGYTNMRIRGSDNTRINVTIDGIPLNNPESMGSVLVNLPDFASSTENIQVQRGVGTSTNGAGAFGASLNIASQALEEKPYAEINNSAGSYNSWKNTVKLGSGLLADKFAVNMRLSKISSDGYIDRAFSDLKSFYLDAGYYSDKHTLKATVFSGKEKTYQAWNGVPEEMLGENRRFNEFEYENQTDNYTQTHHYLHYNFYPGKDWTFNAALHYTKGAGYYEEYRKDDSFDTYGMEPLIFPDDTINTTDLVRRRWLDNHFYGAIYNVKYTPSSTLTFHLGGGYNEYLGDHFGEVIWAQYSSNRALGDQYYFNDAKKTDFNIYGKADYRLNKFLLNLDVQYRHINYNFLGYDHNQKPTDQLARHDFMNPKFGITYLLNPAQQLYVSYAYANKEPIRKDYTESSTESRPKPESMHDVEFGYRLRNEKVQFNANGYAMLYKDQLIVTGEINDVGSAIRQNVPDSYRMGVELDVQWQIAHNLSWQATAALSENKIRDYEEFVDLYDYSSQEKIHYKSTNIAMSPGAVLSNRFKYAVQPNLNISLLSKYVSRQYLDNSSSRERSIADYLVHDLQASYAFSIFGFKNLSATLALYNLLNKKYISNGYTWGYMNESGGRVSHNYYFPQATRNFMLGLNIRL
ncbi:MAG TPA: TonB-dependent receptor [Sphingobacterium sp.]|nr:TonB-dependent receptor [Sphingobacterium sp.]